MIPKVGTGFRKKPALGLDPIAIGLAALTCEFRIRALEAALRAANVTPHVAQNNATTKTGKQRKSAIDGRTTRHAGYCMSQTRRAMIECIFGWGKQHGTMRKTKHRGMVSVGADFLPNLIAYNLIRIPKLHAA